MVLGKPQTDPTLEWFLSHCHIHKYPSKSTLIHQGEKAETLYYIVKGSVAVLIKDEEGKEMILSYLNQGDFIGELGLFEEGQERSAWVRAKTACEVAEISYKKFRQLIHGVVFRRFADQDGLEATGQGGIFFKVFLIFVDSRGADALQIATGQGRFEDVGRIHGTFDGTSPDELMDFVDEEDDRVVLFDCVEDALDPFFKFTTVLGTGDDTGQIEGENALVQQAVGHIASDDALGQAFGDGRLADARGADEDPLTFSLQ